MSHTNRIKGQIKNKSMFIDVCNALGVNMRSGNKHKLYSGEYNGMGITLPGWKYPVIIDDAGNIIFDNYGGSWGDIKHLHGTMDKYNYNVVEAESLGQGHTVHDISDSEKMAMRIETSEGAIEVEFTKGQVLVDAKLVLTSRPRKKCQDRVIVKYGDTDFYEMKMWELLDVRVPEDKRKTDIIPRPTTHTTAVISRNPRSFSRTKRPNPVPFLYESEI